MIGGYVVEMSNKVERSILGRCKLFIFDNGYLICLVKCCRPSFGTLSLNWA
jgi:hypothetical protein